VHGNTIRKRGLGNFDALEFAKALEKAYTEDNRKSGFKTKRSFAPSGLGYGSGRCPRYWFMAFSGVEFDDQADALGIANMSNGTFAHDRMQQLIEKTGKLVEAERKIENESPPILGFADVIIEWAGSEVVGEFKTIKSENYEMVKARAKGLPYHEVQLLIYMHVLKLDDGFLIYENKNTNEFFVVPVTMTERNQKYAEYIFQWMTDVYENFTAGTIPTRSFNKSSKECKYCPIKQACWSSDRSGEVIIPALEVRED
jgi:CRISPR-associated protein Cas4